MDASGSAHEKSVCFSIFHIQKWSTPKEVEETWTTRQGLSHEENQNYKATYVGSTIYPLPSNCGKFEALGRLFTKGHPKNCQGFILMVLVGDDCILSGGG